MAALLVATVLVVGCGGSGDAPASSDVEVIVPEGADYGSAPGANARKVDVPTIEGKSFDHAVRVLRRAGLEFDVPGFTGTVGNPNYDNDCIEVLSQTPPAGERVREGSTVRFVYGACKGSITAGDDD